MAQDDVEGRVAVIRRFRELLCEQRKKFERYLLVLDHERADIETGDVDKLVAHVELEEQIVSEIYTFQKVIDPLEDLYRSAYPLANENDVMSINDSLAVLRSEVARRNAENRGLLQQRMDLLRNEIAGFRNPFAGRHSVYAAAGGGSLVDIQG
jgi:hypothetical protein